MYRDRALSYYTVTTMENVILENPQPTGLRLNTNVMEQDKASGGRWERGMSAWNAKELMPDMALSERAPSGVGPGCRAAAVASRPPPLPLPPSAALERWDSRVGATCGLIDL